MSQKPLHSSIFLIGFMGAGKTDVGRQLSQALNQNFYDSDKVIEDDHGQSIAALFQIHGETWFRQQETKVLESITRQSDIVVATGGGAILSRENRMYLKTRGHVIYLRASLDTLWARVNNSVNTRPLLQVEQPYETMAELLSQREPLYEETAHKIIDTDNLALDEVCVRCQQALIADLREHIKII